MSLLASSSTARGFGGSYGIAGTSHRNACRFEGWQEAGPLNPHRSPHPELGLPRFIQDRFKTTAVVHLEGWDVWGRNTSSSCRQLLLFPASVQEMPLGPKQLVGLSESPAQVTPC